MGFWLVLPYSAIHHQPLLRIAPSGMVPQRDRRPRPIMDYSFNGVNQASLDVAPMQAMQFSTTLQRLLQRIVYSNPTFGPMLMAKIDLANGYYRIPISPQASLALAVVLPSDGLKEPLIGLPLSLPMGWSCSPPYFCAFTETCADLTNSHPASDGPHPFQYALSPSTQIPPPADTFHPTTIFPHALGSAAPLQYTDVYLDDFMVLAQRPHHTATMNTLLHQLSTIFYDPEDSPRRPTVSQSKVSKGDATFATCKRILGWDVDSAALTLHLPPHRVDRLRDLLHTTLSKTHTTRLKWQKLLGELRSMTFAIHSSRYLFSSLQQLLQKAGRRLYLTQLIRRALLDWQHLVSSLAAHPVPLLTTVPHAPHYVGATDASKEGMGGFWLPTRFADDMQPCIWRSKFHKGTTQALVTADHTTGTINNSELELAAAVLGHAIQLATCPTRAYTSTYLATDNTPTQAWIAAGSVSTVKAPSFLLRRLAQDCRLANATLTSIAVPGLSNTIADLLSRSFTLPDAEILARVQTQFPIQPPWRLVTPPEALACEVNSALLSRLPDMEFHPLELPVKTLPGEHGPTSATHYTKIHGCPTWKTPYPSYKSMLRDIEWAQWLPPALLSRLERWKLPFAPLVRRSPHWATLTHGCTLQVV